MKLGPENLTLEVELQAHLSPSLYRPPPPRPLQEERQRVLRSGLDSINREIDSATLQDVAIWVPMGSCNERVIRVVSKEAVLLNSREKVGDGGVREGKSQ
jgi:hypothetical protein